jgi:hypothetical protein
MTDLIKRLEEAEEGCRELDGAIAVIFGWTFERRIPEFKSPKWWPPTELETKERTEAYAYAKANPPAFTTSLDAAVALAERVGLSVSQILNEALEGPSGEGIWATGWNPDKPHAPQIAKFVCIAILKATDTGRE